MLTPSELENLGRRNGTPLFVIDHDEIRKNYRTFRRCLQRVEPYYAIKANSDASIIRTLFREGASFDIASWPEFETVDKNLITTSALEYTHWIHNKIIYSNCIKAPSTLRKLRLYNPLMTFDNKDEIQKIKENAPNARLVLRIQVNNAGAMVELSSKFGASPLEAVDLIVEAIKEGLSVEGISFHVGSQTSNFNNYTEALELTAALFEDVKDQTNIDLSLVDIGGGFPAPYDETVKPFSELAEVVNFALNKYFPPSVRIIAEPGRFIAATACYSVAEVLGVSQRGGRKCYYIDDGVYHTYSGTIFDHCKYPVRAFKDGPTEPSLVYGPCCDALDRISTADLLPDLKRGDLVYSEMMGAYTLASSTNFNGFPPAKVVHVNL